MANHMMGHLVGLHLCHKERMMRKEGREGGREEEGGRKGEREGGR